MSRNQELPGLERPVNKRVATAGEDYVDKMKQAARAGVKRKDAKAELIRVMKEEGVPEYVDMDAKPKPLIVRLETDEKVTVTPYKGEDELTREKKKKAGKKKGDDGDDKDPDPTQPKAAA